MSKKLISVVIPAYNESDCIGILHSKLSEEFNKHENYHFEVIIVDNGSFDDTFAQIEKISNIDPRFKGVRITRNAKADGGISAGLKFASGDAAIITYADLEDPPEVFGKFIEKWEDGIPHVYGITKRRQGSFIRRFNSYLFYEIINKLTNNVVPKNVADFRLVDRKVYTELNNLTERNRFLRGLFSWLNFDSVGVEYDRKIKRAAGNSKASTIAVLRLALQGIFVFSTFPLRIASLVGITVSILSFLGISYFVFQYIFFSSLPFNGFGTLVCIILFAFGFLFTLIGILGEYIALIYDEVQGRPIYIVEKKCGL